MLVNLLGQYNHSSVISSSNKKRHGPAFCVWLKLVKRVRLHAGCLSRPSNTTVHLIRNTTKSLCVLFFSRKKTPSLLYNNKSYRAAELRSPKICQIHFVNLSSESFSDGHNMTGLISVCILNVTNRTFALTCS